MSNNNTLPLGAVAYDPQVVMIWDGFQAYFQKRARDFDYVLYTNYERQVEAQFANQIHVAWNSPLAWVQSERIAAAVGAKQKPSPCETPIATSLRLFSLARIAASAPSLT